MKVQNFTGDSEIKITENEVLYEKVFDETTDIIYSLENTGIKESIIVNTNNSLYTYDFIISSDNIIPLESNGQTITLIDKTTGKSVFIIQPIYIYDSYSGEYVDGEEHITYNNHYEVEPISDDSFIIHMILDDKFLNSDSTVYPCIIDPSICDITYATGTSSYVMQSGGTGYINNQLSAGSFNGSGEHLSYVKASSVGQFRWINPEDIQTATFIVKSASSGYNTSCKINLYDSTTTSNVSSVTYSELITSLGNLQSSTTFTSLNTSYSFNVTELYKQWISYELGTGGKNPAYGFILRGESGASTPGRWFSSTGTSDTYFRIDYQSSIIISDGFYNIKNVYTGKYLKYNNGNQLSLSTNAYSDNCKWQIILSKNPDRTIEDGTYRISPYNNLNTFMSGLQLNQPITTNSIGNKYRIIRNSDDTFRIMPDNGNGTGTSNTIGVSSDNVYVQTYSYVSTKEWIFEPVINRYYSEYSPELYNEYPIDDRLNCYAYAFGFIEHYYVPHYEQQIPGKFASDANQYLYQALVDYNNPPGLMNKLISNMNLDAENIGYTLTEYTPTGDNVNQYGANSRLIAAVVSGNNRIHFYMQHNDGTWSHKNGTDYIRDTAFSSTQTEPRYLNNGNIRQYAYDHYETGLVKFFIITKDAIYDYPHGKSNSTDQNVFYFTDIAGDNIFTSSNLTIGEKSACIDTQNDADFYVFTPSQTRNYSIQTTSFVQDIYGIVSDTNIDDLDCYIYDKNGQVIYTITNIGQVNATINLTYGQNYYIKIYNYSQRACDYKITIT